MTLFNKRTIAMTLLLSTSSLVHPIDYQKFAFPAAVGLGAIITSKMIYNFFKPETDLQIIEKAQNECQEIINKQYTLVQQYHAELHALKQVPQNTQTILEVIKNSYKVQWVNYPLYYYVAQLDRHILQCQTLLQEATYLEQNLSRKNLIATDEYADFDRAIECICIEKNNITNLLNDLIAIKNSVISTMQYKEQSIQYAKQAAAQDFKPHAITTCHVHCKPIVAKIEKNADEKLVIQPTPRAEFNSDWCDATNPFNS